MPHVAHVAHHSPGRLRIRVPAAKGNAAGIEAIRQSLTKVPGVQQVTINPTIGTITIHYDARHHAAFEKHLAAEASQCGLVKIEPEPKVEELRQIDSTIETEAAFLADHSVTAKAIFDAISSVDHVVKRTTGNTVDLKVILPLALAVGAFMELGVAASTPVWLTLGLFSFNHFVDLHAHNDPKSGSRTKTRLFP